MNESFLCKTLSKVSSAAAVVGVLMITPMHAQATALQFSNLDTSGTPGSFIQLDKLNTIASLGMFSATSLVGADHTLNLNDTFSESLDLITNSSSLGTNPTLFGLGGDYRIAAIINGIITGSSGTPIIINPDNSVSSDATSIVNIAFVAGTTLDLFNNITNEHIASLQFVSGGAQNVNFVAGQFIGDITINSLIGPGCVNCDPYLQTLGGGTVTGSSIFTITTGSERFASFNGTDYSSNTLVTNFLDNGTSSTFDVPEPGSLALIGLGLLGIGATRRRIKSL